MPRLRYPTVYMCPLHLLSCLLVCIIFGTCTYIQMTIYVHMCAREGGGVHIMYMYIEIPIPQKSLRWMAP